VLDVLLQLAHRDAGHDAVGGRGHRLVGHPARDGHQLQLELGLDPPHLRHERAAVDDGRVRQRQLQLERRAGPRPGADPDPGGAAEAGGRPAKECFSVVGLVHDDDLTGPGAAQVEGDEHARQHEQRLPSGGDERTGDPAVRVRDLPERRQITLEACQVLEVGRRRQEERIDPRSFEALEHALAAERQLGGEVRVHWLGPPPVEAPVPHRSRGY
jgi:hypothetical protein